MVSKRKNIQIGNTITIPILPAALAVAFCLWNAVFFLWIMPADGIILIPKDGIITEDYPHMLNAFTSGVVWGLATSPFLFAATRYMLWALHIGGMICVAAFVHQATVHATCASPLCG